MSGTELESLIENLPEGVVTAMGYDRIGTAGGYLTSTVYGLLAPALLLVFAISTGARLIAGQEEDGTLELEFAAPVGRTRVLAERIAALWLDLIVLVGIVTLVTIVFVALLDMEVGITEILAGSSGLLLFVVGFGTLSLAVGAITGRRTIALGVAAGLAVLAFILDAIGPTVDAGWMTAVSPFSWYLADDPLINGFDLQGLLLLALIPILSVVAAMTRFDRRDLMV
jgi:ABC-2 type transport system permease protein